MRRSCTRDLYVYSQIIALSLFVSVFVGCGDNERDEPVLSPNELILSPVELLAQNGWTSTEFLYQGQVVDSLFVEFYDDAAEREGMIVYNRIDLYLNDSTNWQGYYYDRTKRWKMIYNTEYTVTSDYDAYTFRDWSVNQDEIMLYFQLEDDKQYEWYTCDIEFINNNKFIIKDFPVHRLGEGRQGDYSVNGGPVSIPSLICIDITFEPKLN